MEADTLTVELARRVERATAEAERIRLKAESDKLKADAAKAAALEVKEKATSPAPAATPRAPSPAVKQEASPAQSPRASSGEQAELDAFTDQLKQAFAPVKIARSKLEHYANIEKAQAFAESLLVAWSELVKGGAK
jgi:hypothetical protein